MVTTNEQDAVLVRLEQAKNLLATCHSAADAKRVADMARAAEVYGKRQGLAEEAISHATAIRVDALTLLGEMLKVTEKNKGAPGPGRGKVGEKASSPREPAFQQPPTLAECGISKKESSDSQTLADIREKMPDLHAAVRAGKVSVKKATARVRAATRTAPVEPPKESDSCSVITDLASLVTKGEKYGCIYADPPWRYGNQGTRAATDNHYGTMTVAEIVAMPIGKLAADKSHLWLWTTNGFLFECPRIFEAWGFEFKSSYVWVKTQMGIGNYTRCSHEFLLLGVRGGLTGAARDVKSWGEFPRGKHSAKPEAIRTEVVERLSPGPRLELFGRHTVPGWTVFGNQVERSLLDVEAES